jgi:hypothetical protein
MIEVDPEGAKTILEELPTTSKNRQRLHTMRNDILMVHPTKNIVISENNAWT